MTTRTIGAMACVLVLGGCGTEYEYLAEDQPEATLPAVEVTPARLVPGEGTTGTSEEDGPRDAETVAFLKRLPANPTGRPADGLVRTKEWAGLSWKKVNPAEVTPWKWTRSSDDVLLLVKVKAGRHDKAGMSRPVGLALAEKGTLRMDLYNDADREIQVAFAVFASADRVYCESELRAVQPGWNHIVFDLSASTFKSASSEWKHTTKIWKGEDVRELALVFYDKAGATLVVDSMEIDAKPSGSGEPKEE